MHTHASMSMSAGACLWVRRDYHSPFWATIMEVRQLHTPESGRSCVHVELDMRGCCGSGLSTPTTTSGSPVANSSPLANGMYNSTRWAERVGGTA